MIKGSLKWIIVPLIPIPILHSLLKIKKNLGRKCLPIPRMCSNESVGCPQPCHVELLRDTTRGYFRVQEIRLTRPATNLPICLYDCWLVELVYHHCSQCNQYYLFDRVWWYYAIDQEQPGLTEWVRERSLWFANRGYQT